GRARRDEAGVGGVQERVEAGVGGDAFRSRNVVVVVHAVVGEQHAVVGDDVAVGRSARVDGHAGGRVGRVDVVGDDGVVEGGHRRRRGEAVVEAVVDEQQRVAEDQAVAD